MPGDRESAGRIITLSTGRFGVLAPRAPRQRKRRQLGAAGSVKEAQRILDDWREGRRLLVEEFLPWLSRGCR